MKKVLAHRNSNIIFGGKYPVLSKLGVTSLSLLTSVDNWVPSVLCAKSWQNFFANDVFPKKHKTETNYSK